MRIAFISPDYSDVNNADGNKTPGGSNYARCFVPGAALEAAGHTVIQALAIQWNGDREVIEVMDGPTDHRTLHTDIDVVVLHRWMDQVAAPITKTARRSGQIVINDVDDWWWGMRPSNASFTLFHPRYNLETNLAFYARNLGMSSAITCSTPFLAERMAQRTTRPTYLVRNCIEAERYPNVDVSGPTCVGWIGASTARSGDLESLGGILLPWCRKTGAGFFHGGADRPQHSARMILGFPEDWPGTSKPMQTIEDYPKLFRRGKFNIGLVPLSSAPFNEAKSFIKGLEYAASGIPFIAQATPEYRYLADEFNIGIVAERPKHWLKALDRLADPEERVKLGALYRERVQDFTPTNADLAGQWERIVAEVTA